jgi:hypothetical protein
MKNKSTLSLIILSLFLFTSNHAEINNGKKIRDNPVIKNIYRVYAECKDGKNIWIVDGLIVRNKIFNEFLYGGNNERYPFIPHNEIWIDNAISAEEYKYTVAHELNERNLMAKKAMSYDEAHDSSLALERRLRLRDNEFAVAHENSQRLVSPTDCDGIKEINTLPDSIKLKNVYRQFIGTRNNLSIWIVDGAIIRRNAFPDFGLSGNDLAYHFIPKNEIWIDAQISCEETQFSITSELKEREFMASGLDYDQAYTYALKIVDEQRDKQNKKSSRHNPIIIPKILFRDKGTGSEK